MSGILLIWQQYILRHSKTCRFVYEQFLPAASYAAVRFAYHLAYHPVKSLLAYILFIILGHNNWHEIYQWHNWTEWICPPDFRFGFTVVVFRVERLLWKSTMGSSSRRKETSSSSQCSTALVRLASSHLAAPSRVPLVMPDCSTSSWHCPGFTTTLLRSAVTRDG